MLLSLLLIASAAAQLVRETTLPESSKCDDVEKSGSAKVPIANSPKRETCMSGSESAEDRWFKETICAKWAFSECEAGESQAECDKANEQACEDMRATWLGRLGIFPHPEIDPSNTRKQSQASGTVLLGDSVSWFDSQTPVADFSLAGSDPTGCSYRQSNWQDETEFNSLKANTDPLPSSCGASLPSGFSKYDQTLYGVLQYLLDMVYDEMSPDGAEFNGSSKPVVRKDIRTLNESDRKKYLTALHKTECLGLTKIWGAIHASSPADMHGGPAFLPSHSVFMRVYELSLQDFGGLGRDIGLHIGGWPADSTLPRWHNGRIRFSAIWGDDYIGAIADQYIGSEKLEAKSDIFTSGVWQTPSPSTDSPTLVRSFRNVERRGGYISPQDVWGALAINDPMCFGQQLERSLLHGGHHMVISGHMGNLLAASWDAAFFMHHAFDDCVWREWQLQTESKEARASKASFPDVGSSWTRHRPTDSAHWTIWSSPAAGGAERRINHEDAWNYRNKGRGSYKCHIPSLLPCETDEDCGVPAGVARDEKRLYCASAGVCSQYVETNAICRNEIGAYLPCRKSTDRCQFSPTLYAKYNSGRTTSDESVHEAWFCVASDALECGQHTSKSACTGNCQWQDTTTGVQVCESKVPAFGFGVVEEASETMQSFGSTFNFLDPSLPKPSSNTWSLVGSGGGIAATLKAVKYEGKEPVEDAALKFHRTKYSFGIDDTNAAAGPTCDSSQEAKFGDYKDQLDRHEAIEITFREPVALESMKLGNFGSTDRVEFELFLNGEMVGLQSFNTGEIVFGTSSPEASLDSCPTQPSGQVACVVDKVLMYHETAIVKSKSSAKGVMKDGKCKAKIRGQAFSLKSLTVSSQVVVKMGAGTPNDFEGFCTGAPNNAEVQDYDMCANEDRCYMDPESGPEVNVILVPAGVCGPKGWRPMIEFIEKTESRGQKLEAKYRNTCPCGALSSEKLTGDGPKSGSGKYLPLLDLYRTQDRMNGNDDANREEDDTGSSALFLAPLLVSLAAVNLMF